MPLKHGLDDKWWHGMKATICECCGRVTPTDQKGAMLYDFGVFSADGYEAETEEERALTVDIEDICTPCIREVIKAVRETQARLKERGPIDDHKSTA
jgi:hypothetical protein